MKKTILFAGFFSMILWFSGCSVHEIDFEPKNFSEEVPPEQYLAFKFNVDILSDESFEKFKSWHDAKYLQFTPAISGKYKWTSKKELLFAPTVPLKPSTDYSVKIFGLPVQHEYKNLKITAQSLSFHTPYFSLTEAIPFWDNNNQLKLWANFNYEVSPNSLASFLKITSNNSAAPYQLLTEQPSNSLLLSINSIPPDASPLQITLEKDFLFEASQWKNPNPQNLNVSLPEKTFEIIKTEQKHDGYTGTIILWANHAFPSQDNLNNFISIEPKVSFTASAVENQLILKGEFLLENAYTVTLKEQLPTAAANPMPQPYSTTIQFDNQEKFIKFTSQEALYLNQKGNKNIGLHLLNVPEFKLKVFKIFENNLTHFLKNSEYNYDYYYYSPESEGSLIYEKTFETRELQKIGNFYALNVDIEDVLPDYKGIYYVQAVYEDEYYVQAGKLVCITDIGLLVKHTMNGLTVFANTLSAASPLPNLTLKLYSKNNQVIATTQTDGAGVAHFKDLDPLNKHFEPIMLTASTPNDFAFLYFPSSRWDPTDFDIAGKKRIDPNYDAFIYAERTLYRPGETAHFNAILRTHLWKNVPKMPVLCKIINPKAQVAFELNAQTDHQSAFQWNFEIPKNAPTGTYQVLLLSAATQQPLQNFYFQVEDFLPDRIKLKTSLQTDTLIANQPNTLLIHAENFYGTPAARRNVETTIYFTPVQPAFNNPELQKFHFTLQSKQPTPANLFYTSQTDADGNASIAIPAFNEKNRFSGILNVAIFTTVFDQDNKPVHKSIIKKLYTQNVFYGIHAFEPFVNTQMPLNAPIIAVNSSGKILQNTSAKVQIIKHSYQTVVERVYYETRLQTRKKSHKVYEKLLTLNGTQTRLDFTPAEGGEYEIRILDPNNDNSFVSYPFFAYGFFASTNDFNPDPKARITIETNLKEYLPNQNATVLFKTPFDGKLIVTLEQDKILKHYFLQTEKQLAKLQIPLTEAHVPNIFVTATLIRPLTTHPMPFTVAYGVKNLPIKNPLKKIPVQIIAKNNSYSRTTQTITVKTKPFSEVTLAAVDEGILQIQNYQTPDPYAYFYAPRQLENKHYDPYTRILPEIGGKKQKQSPKIGGGGPENKLAAAEDTRNNPFQIHKQLVSFWRKSTADANGNATFQINIPAFNGQLRLMAASYFNDNFGANQAFMTVADPIILRIGAPPFIASNDTAILPITLTNTTQQNQQISIALTASNLTTIHNLPQSLQLPPKQEQQFFITVTPKTPFGAASLTIKANHNNLTYSEQTEISIRPAAPLTFQSYTDILPPNTNKKLSFPNNFIPQTAKMQLFVSNNPIALIAKPLHDLLQYPHGCAEQTISTAFPQIYAQQLLQQMQKKHPNPRAAQQHVQMAIYKIENLINYNGGVAYWEGSYNPSWWTTAYATHFFLEAKNNQFNINPNKLNSMLRFLLEQTNNAYLLKNNRYPRELAYSLFVLAMAGKPNTSKMKLLKGKLQNLYPDSQILLACAFALAGDHASFQQLINTPLNYEPSAPEFIDFSSSNREKALILSTLLDVQPNHPQINLYLQQLIQTLQSATSLNTQEMAFAILAIGKFAKINQNNNASATLSISGKTYNVQNEPLFLTLNQHPEIQIQTQGNGKIYYTCILSGVPTEPNLPNQDQFLKVRRTLLDKNGLPLSRPINVNDLIIVKVDIQSLQNASIPNIAITDVIPAGFQIENPRLNFIADQQLTRNANTPDYQDLREDRIHIYTTATPQNKTFYFYLRATTKGTFTFAPIAADAMYDPNIHSYFGQNTVKIQ